LKIFVAGATGAIGRRLVPMLHTRGHEVVAMTRSSEKAEALRRAGVEPVVADALDRDAVGQAVTNAAPEVVIHELTDLTRLKSFKRFDQELAGTNRLRTAGTDNLLAAARAAGARRFVAQSYGSWIYEPTGPGLKTEVNPLNPSPLPAQRLSLAAIRHLEEAVTGTVGLDGIALRYGSFYGPGTGLARDGDLVQMVRKRQLPVVGAGTGVWSFLHVDDAAEATVAAVERGAPGLYNVCDDEPAPVAAWLPALAEALGAPPPRHVPTWLARLSIGEVGVSFMTRIRGMSNGKAKRELGWTPSHASWRQGFQTGL
jgi:nucleoside-diphosphate-sugar epimerase